MSDLDAPQPTPASGPDLFRLQPRAESTPWLPWAAAGLVVLAILATLLLLGHRRHPVANTPLPPDPYGVNLAISDLAMSESTSLSGGKSTFLDGRIRNTGPKTVTAVTMQILFRNDEALPPQIEILPLALIRTRQPYVDTQPVSAEPLKPGDEREFRLIFESVAANWNTQMPDLQAIHILTN